MSEPHGPIKIGGNRQIALPKALMERLSLQPDDSVYALADDRIDGALLIVPVERLTEWLRRGRAHEAAERERIEHDG